MPKLFKIGFVFMGVLFALSSQAAPKPPLDVIKGATDNLVGELSSLSNKERTSTKIRSLVMQHLVPVIDIQRIAKSALAEHWPKASEKQRNEFMKRFLELQIRSYTGAFQAFKGQKMSFQNVKYNTNRSKAIVPATLMQNNGYPMPIQFRLYKAPNKDDWKVYDAQVAGFGMVKLYRAQVAERLKSISMDQLLDELDQK